MLFSVTSVDSQLKSKTRAKIKTKQLHKYLGVNVIESPNPAPAFRFGLD